MNPLDLRGPEFLLFYLVYGALVLWGLAAWRRRVETADGVGVKLSDPYLIAQLRGGRNEALRVATLSLIDRGLLQVRGQELAVAEGVTPDAVRRPIEKEILALFARGNPAWLLFDTSAAGAATLAFERALLLEGLLPGEPHTRQRRGRAVWAVVLLAGLAFVKLLVALARGRTNVLFLIVLAVLFTLVAVARAFPRRTAKGDALLADLRALFAGLRQRAASLHPGGATSEVALLAAVFGLSALPATGWAEARALLDAAQRGFPNSGAGGASSGGSGSVFDVFTTSSCGSASSCGGGSCGGGCGGGCGGCGS